MFFRKMAKIRHTKITAAVYVHRIFSCIYDIATCMYTYTAGTCLRAPFALAKRTNATLRCDHELVGSACVRTTNMMALKAAGPAQATAAKPGGVGMEPVVGSLTAGKKNREYKVTNRLLEGKRPLYAICFNLIDSRFHNVFASAGCNRVPECRQSPTPPFFLLGGATHLNHLDGMSQWKIFSLFMSGSWVFSFCTNAGDGVPVPDRGRSSCSFACFH